MLSIFASAFKTPELRKEVFFTLGIPLVFCLGSTIPAPNVNTQASNTYFDKATRGQQARPHSLINLFSGGVLLRLTILAPGVTPYITSLIILQFLTVVIPRLEALRREGAAGQAEITQCTRYPTLVLALLQATVFVTMTHTGQLLPDCEGIGILHGKVELFPLITMVPTMIARTAAIIWLGELITDRGISSGMSVSIFIQIVTQFPAGLWFIREGHQGAAGRSLFLVIVAIGLLVILGILFMEQGQRRIPAQCAKRMAGRRLVGGSTTYTPLKISQPGIIPMIFVNPILYLPILYIIFRPQSETGQWIVTNFHTSSWVCSTLQFLLTAGFCYFYVTIIPNSEEVSDNMKKYGSFTPGICTGGSTEHHPIHMLNCLTVPGSLYLAIISMTPTLVFAAVGVNQNFPFGGTSILITVGVALGMVKCIESQL